MRKSLFATSMLALSAITQPLSAATANLTGGTEDGGTILNGVPNFVIDLGFLVPSLPASPNLALFEAGGDGDGTAITLIGSSIVVYLDNSVNSILADDTTFAIDVSSFAGQVVSIRLQGDYTGGSDTAQLDIFNGSSNLSSGLVALNTDHSGAAGLDGLGTGGRGVNSFPGAGEAGSDMAQFNTTAYDIGDGGANVIGNDVVTGIVYTAGDATTAKGTAIVDPSTWGIVPEPSSLALLGLGGLLVARRRR